MKSSNISTRPAGNSGVDLVAEWSPAPLLDAFENFRGSFVDLDHNIRISAGRLREFKALVRQQMTRAGLSEGARLIAALPNGPLFAAVWAASLEAGALPILVHGETPGPELDRMAKRWAAEFVVAEASVENRSGTQPSEVLTAGEHLSLRWQRTGKQGCNGDQVRMSAVPLHPTSGTSGGPKLAARPGPCAVAEPHHYIETLSIDQSDTILCAIPMSHAYAYGMCFMVALLTSADLVYMRQFNPVLVHQALRGMKISIFPAVPMMLNSLLATDVEGLISRPRVVLSAGAPLTRNTFEAMQNRYGISVCTLYGTTETGGISIDMAREEFDGGVGAAMRGVELDLSTSGDQGLDADVGILRVRSSSMMAGYVEEGGINRGAITDGWFETGDLAKIDSEGRVHLQGRQSEVINVFGFKVIPREVEEVIGLLPEVLEVKVYASHSLGPDVIEVAVVRRGPLTEKQILRHCDMYLVSYKCPTAIRFVDFLPRTPSGKVAVERLSKAATD
jgi:acyl-CoA synthetase (AMP-forming)/AMP-acid ligase II